MRINLQIVGAAVFACATISFTPVQAQDAGTSGATTAPAASIFDAARSGNANQVNVLLGRDPSLAKATDDNGVSALIYAVHEGKSEVAKLLMEKGADVNAKAPGNHRTAIFEAAANGEVDVV